jgi:hypothetical protein
MYFENSVVIKNNRNEILEDPAADTREFCPEWSSRLGN